jgi:hypothetical protein
MASREIGGRQARRRREGLAVALKARERIVENLAVAAALGLLALLAAAMSLIADSRSAAAERAAFAPYTAALASRVDDPAFERVFSIASGAGSAFGIVLSLRSPDASALFGAVFTPRGELREIRILGGCSSRLPDDAKGALGLFAGAEDALARAAEAVRSAARGADASPEGGS